jgi:hypothetical protein
MRGAGIGLIGILLAGGIIFYLTWGGPGNPGYVRPALETKRDTEVLTNAISGRDAQGQAVTDSITYEATGKGILIQTVTPGGALDVKFGLKPGDVIVELGPLAVDQFANSDDAARDFMQAQYARPDSWVVIRNGKKIRLPEDRNIDAAVPAPGTAVVNPANPANPQPAPQRNNPLKQARDLTNKIESH